MLSDFLFSTYIIMKLKLDINTDEKKDDTPIVRKEMRESIKRYHLFYIRLLTAFPDILKYKNFLSFKYLKSLLRKKKTDLEIDK